MNIAAVLMILFTDVPDYTITWNSMSVIQLPGSSEILDCRRSADGNCFEVICSQFFENEKSWNMIEVDGNGRLADEVLLMTDRDVPLEWVCARFSEEGTACLAFGPGYGEGDAFLTVMNQDSASPDTLCNLSSAFPRYHGIEVFELASVEGGILVVGTGYADDPDFELFAAEIDLEGRLLWTKSLADGIYNGLNSVTLEVLSDGGAILSYSEDCFPSGVPVLRIDDSGEVIWSEFIQLDCEFYACLNGFLEFDNGNLFFIGGFDQMGQMLHRGLMLLLDEDGREMRREIVWYLDHTSLVYPEMVNEDDLLVIGWVGTSGDFPIEVRNMDVLITGTETDRFELTGVRIQGDGDEKPFAVFTDGHGGLDFVGTVTPDGEDQADIFLGTVSLSH